MAASMPKNTGPFRPGSRPKLPSGSQAAAKKASAAKDAIRKTAASSGSASKKKAVPMKPARPTYTKPGFRSRPKSGGVNKGPSSRNRY